MYNMREKPIKELSVGKKYTSDDILDLMIDNSNISVLCDSINCFQRSEEFCYLVTKKIESYLHTFNWDAYMIPYEKSVIYIVSKA